MNEWKLIKLVDNIENRSLIQKLTSSLDIRDYRRQKKKKLSDEENEQKSI